MEKSHLSRKFTRRFVAGETLDDALGVVETLEREKIHTTLDHLGENVTSIEEAAASRDAYLEALARIAKLPATVSIKLTQFGLDLSEDACLENVRRLAAEAKRLGSRVEIDMESSGYTDRTLAIVERIAAEFACTRSVIQAYLFRSAADIDRLNRLAIPVRLCKGAYDEPATVAFPEKRAVDRNYVTLMKTLLDHGSYPAIATHDERIVGESLPLRARAQNFPRPFRVPDAVRHPPRSPAPHRGSGLHAAPVRPLRNRVVSVLHAPPGRAPGECGVPDAELVSLVWF